MQFESAEWAESSESFILLTEKRLDYFWSDLKLVFNQQNQQKIELGWRFTWKITTGLTNSCCIAPHLQLFNVFK